MNRHALKNWRMLMAALMIMIAAAVFIPHAALASEQADPHIKEPIENVSLTVYHPIEGMSLQDDVPKVETPYKAPYGVLTFDDGEKSVYVWGALNYAPEYVFNEKYTVVITLEATDEHFFTEDVRVEVKGGELLDKTVDDSGEYLEVRAEVTAASHDLAKADVSGIEEQMTYTGRPVTQNPVITMLDEKLNAGYEYSVSYENNTDVGYATMRIAGTRDYTGELYYYFEIVPPVMQVLSVVPRELAAEVNWGRLGAEITGYEIQICQNEDFESAESITEFDTASVSRTISGLESGVIYYVRARVFTDIGGGSVLYSEWSDVKSVVPLSISKPEKTAISSLTAKEEGFTASWEGQKNLAEGYELQYGLKKDFSDAVTSRINKRTTTSKTFNALKGGKKYFVRVRTWRVVDGVYYTSAWSARKSIKTLKVSKPEKTAISSLKAKSGGFTVKWEKKTELAKGYEIEYSLKKDFSGAKTVTVTKNKTVSKSITGLKKGKVYYVRIRTYRTVNGNKYYSAWSAVKNIKTLK